MAGVPQRVSPATWPGCATALPGQMVNNRFFLFAHHATSFQEMGPDDDPARAGIRPVACAVADPDLPCLDRLPLRVPAAAHCGTLGVPEGQRSPKPQAIDIAALPGEKQLLVYGGDVTSGRGARRRSGERWRQSAAGD
eukprot:3169855-Alexandrium_andersonii.AAC.1